MSKFIKITFFCLFGMFYFPTPSQAEGNCPPGYYPIGGGTSGWHGCAPMNGGINNDTNYQDDYDDGEYYRNQKLKERQDFLIFWETEGKFVFQKQAEEQKKQLEKYETGFWEIFQGNKSAKKGEYCTALFAHKNGIIAINGPGGDFKGALLSFTGKDIPKSKKPQIIEVTLEQTGDKPQKVKAFNYSNKDMKFGTISFAVPSINDAMDNMTDKLSFKVKKSNKTFIDIEWQQGIEARKKLNNCIIGK